MFYYRVVSADAVSPAVKQGARIGIKLAMRVLSGSMPADNRADALVRWIVRCAKDECKESHLMQDKQIAGLYHIGGTVYVNADVSPDSAIETAAHEMYHVYQHKVRHITLTTQNEPMIEKHADEFTAQIMELVAGFRTYIRANGLVPEEAETPRERYSLPLPNIVNLNAVRYARRRHVKIG